LEVKEEELQEEPEEDQVGVVSERFFGGGFVVNVDGVRDGGDF
jgi:hypothetical protein